jgi:hypothetical protein
VQGKERLGYSIKDSRAQEFRRIEMLSRPDYEVNSSRIVVALVVAVQSTGLSPAAMFGKETR